MKTIRLLLCLVTGLLISALSAKATPYASGVTNQSGTVQFILNELPDSAWIIFEDGSSNNIAAPVVGTNTFALGAHTKFGIYVKKSGDGTPVQISDDSGVYNNWNTPRGVGINVNPTNGYLFGRVYVNNSLAGSVLGKGIYALNADQSDLLGGTTGLLGATWANAGSSSSPYRIHVGADDNNLYLGDFTAVNATIYQALPDLSAVTNVFGELGESAGIAAGVHGRSFGRPIVNGSIAGGDMVMWVADASLPVDANGANTTLGYNAAPGNVNNLVRYTIGAGPLPWTNPPDLAMTLGIASIPDLDDDIDVDPVTGNIFGMNYRANYGMPILQVYDPTGMNLLWSSLEGPINVGPDFFNFDFSGSQFSVFTIAISPDGRFLAAGLINNPLLILDLTNGVPDTSTLTIISNAPNSGGYEDLRSICWDAADNLYAISSGQGLLRVFSLGLPATCVTSNDVTSTNGTFALLLPSIKASVVATTPYITQNGGVPGVFTITLNTNVLTSPVVVNFVLGGSATNGTYIASATNSITFPAGTSTENFSQTVTITPTATPVSGPTFTVTLTIHGGVTYLAQAPVSDTVVIANSGPQYFSVTSVSAGTLYRGLTNDFGEFVITRLGDTNVGPLTITNFSYGGTATFGVDYLAGAQLEVGSYPVTGSPGVVFNPGDVSKTIIVGEPVPTPYGSPTVGNETIVVGLGTTNSQTSAEGIPYTTGPAAATITLLDNANPPELVLWSDPLTSAADSVNWALTFAGTNLSSTTVPPIVLSPYSNTESGGPGYGSDNGGTNDWDVEFGYAVATDSIGQSLAMAANGWTNALKMTVNKDPNFAGASMGVNVYPIGKSFGGNYALRFSMNLIEGSGYPTGTYESEAAEFGINHTGTNCNWVSGDIVVGPPQIGSGYTNIDGVWITLDSGAGIATGGTPPDFGLFTAGPSSALQTLPNQGWYQPVSDPGTAEATVYKHSTPYDASGVGTPAARPPGVWSDVELKQYNGTVTLSINKTAVLTYAVTNQFTNGDVMLGYDDPFANVSVDSGAAVYYSNLRVVELAPYIVSLTPALLTVDQGGSATFTLAATGTLPFTNVWYFGATPIRTNVVNASSDSDTLTIPAAQSANAGSYSVVVSDLSGGSVTSSVVTLAVTVLPPDFTGVSLSVDGSTASLLFTTGNPFDGTNSFTLQVSTNLAGVNSGFTNVVGATIIATNGGFEAQTATSGPAAFYRLLHN
jgi:hypothetical protein